MTKTWKFIFRQQGHAALHCYLDFLSYLTFGTVAKTNDGQKQHEVSFERWMDGTAARGAGTL